ncbi:polyphosphate kinase [Prevotella sp. CAG:732]|nr:polyphosphate kinase [Prevotella sp. CAG:732]
MTKEEIIKKAYVERDVSWMYFNHRILQEAKKEFVPLLERLSFLGIYSNNLDEFFRVRVASLNRMIDRNLTKDMEAQIKKSLKTINKLNESYSKEYTEAVDQVFRELEVHKVRLVTETNLNDEQKNFLTQFFYDKLNGSVNPIWLNEIDDLSTLEDNRIYLAIEKTEMENNDEDEKGKKKKDDKKGKKKYAVVKVSDRVFGRWVKIPSSDGFDNIMYLDDVIRYCLPLVFLGFKESSYRAYSFKFTKDAEMEMDNDADFGTMEKIALGVNSRKKGEAGGGLLARHLRPRDAEGLAEETARAPEHQGT